MEKILLLLFVALSNTYVLAQSNLNLRKVIQKSDFIIDTNDYRSDTIWINDFTYKKHIQIDKIDSKNSFILLNKLNSLPKNLTLREPVDKEDFYSFYSINQECACCGSAGEMGKSYSDLFFIIREKNEYKILMHLYGIEFEQRKKYRHQIETIRDFENIKNEKERFIKTLDWFLENGMIPDEDFIKYYKTKGITNDTIQYTEKQYEKAFQKFQSGTEDLLPIVRKKYFNEIKKYYVKKMDDVLNLNKPEFKDYYIFYESFQAILGEKGLDYDSADYILLHSLISDKFEQYEKYNIMKHLIEVTKEWKYY